MPASLRIRALISSLVLLLPAAPAHAAGPAGWDHPGFDAEDSYYNPAEAAINVGTIAKLTRRWSVRLRRHDGTCAGPSAPLVAGGRVFATDQLGISAYQTSTGAPAWRHDWPDPGDTSTPTMAVAGNVLVAAYGDCNSVSDPDGGVIGLDVATGRPRWHVPTDNPIYSVVVDKNVVVVSGESPSDELATFAYRTTDGRLIWTKPGYSASSVSLNGRMLVTNGGATSAVAVATGAVQWTKPRVWHAQSATPDRFLVTEGAALAAVDSATGAVAWTAQGKAAELLATDGRRVYRVLDRTVEALDARNGRRVWSRLLPAAAGQPVRAGGLLYTGRSVLNAANGAVVSPGVLFAGQQIITGGRLFTVADDTLSSLTP